MTKTCVYEPMSLWYTNSTHVRTAKTKFLRRVTGVCCALIKNYCCLQKKGLRNRNKQVTFTTGIQKTSYFRDSSIRIFILYFSHFLCVLLFEIKSFRLVYLLRYFIKILLKRISLSIIKSKTFYEKCGLLLDANALQSTVWPHYNTSKESFVF